MSNNLKLQIILAAADKLTAPMRRMLQGSGQLAAGLKEAKQQAKLLDGVNLDINKYRELSRSMGITSNELKLARARAEELAKGINSTNSPTKGMIREFTRAKDVVNELQGKHTTLINKQQRLRQSMSESGVNVKTLASEQRRLKSELTAANQAVDEQRKKLDRLNETQKRLNTARANYQKTKDLQGRLAGNGAAMVATGGAMASPVIAAVKQYADFEDAMKGVARQVSGARDGNGKLTQTYFDMAKAIKAISERLPSENGAIDIAALVEGAARMGIQGKENLLAFAETSAKASKAFELPAGDLAENMGKIASLYKIPIKDIERLGDTINWLDDNAQSKGSDIIDVLQRMGGVADRLDYKKAAALGSTFLSLGAQSEVAATASIAMVRELSIATMQSKRFQEGMDTLGLSSEKMEKRMGKDAMGTIITVLEQIKKLPKDAQMRVTTQLFGKEYGKDAAKLANNLDELHKQLRLVNDEKARGSMQRESDIDADSLSAQWTLLKTGMSNTFNSMGSTLRAPLMDILGRIKQITIATRMWVEAHPELTGNILKALAVVSAITIAVGGLALGVAAILGPLALAKFSLSTLGIKILPNLGAVLVGTGGSLKEFSRLLQSTRAGGFIAEWKAATTAIAGADSPLAKMWMQIRRNRGGLVQLTNAYVATKQAFSKSLSVLSTVKNNPLQFLISGAQSAGRTLWWLVSSPFKAIGSAISWLGSTVLWLGRLFLFNPVGLFVTAVAAGAMLIFKYWEPVKAFIGGVIDGFSAAIEPIKGLFSPLQPIFDGIGNALKWVFDLFGDLFTPVKSTSEELSSAAEMGRKFGEWLAEGVNIAMAPLKLLIDGIKWVLDNLPGLDKKIDIPENFKPGPAMPWQQNSVNNFAGMYDSGGTIPKGKFGIAGENGPEVIGGPAYVLSRAKTAALMSAFMTMQSPVANSETFIQPPKEIREIKEVVSSARLQAIKPEDRIISERVNAVSFQRPPSGIREILEVIKPAKLSEQNQIKVITGEPHKEKDRDKNGKRELADITIHAPITIVQQPGQSDKLLAETIQRHLDTAQRNARKQSRNSLSDRD